MVDLKDFLKRLFRNVNSEIVFLSKLDDFGRKEKTSGDGEC